MSGVSLFSKTWATGIPEQDFSGIWQSRGDEFESRMLHEGLTNRGSTHYKLRKGGSESPLWRFWTPVFWHFCGKHMKNTRKNVSKIAPEKRALKYLQPTP